MSSRTTDELLDKYFESFKHLSTLSVALGIAVLIVFRGSAGRIGIMGSMASLAAAFVLSLLGMLLVVLRLRYPEPGSDDGLLWWLLALSGVFLLGVPGGLALTAAFVAFF